jgi:hypothetical protein
MKTFKYLQCNDIDLISVKIYNYLSNLPTWDPKFVGQCYLDNLDVIETIPELKEFIEQHNLSPRRAFYVHHTLSGQVHVDGSADIRLFLPVLRTHGTALTHFYELENVVKTTLVKNGQKYHKLDFSNKTLIDTYELTQPVLANTAIPHQVVFQKQMTMPRISLSLHLNYTPGDLLVE